MTVDFGVPGLHQGFRLHAGVPGAGHRNDPVRVTGGQHGIATADDGVQTHLRMDRHLLQRCQQRTGGFEQVDAIGEAAIM